MASFIELGIFALISGFTTSFGIVLNDWIFKKRIEKALDKLEQTIREKFKNEIKTT